MAIKREVFKVVSVFNGGIYLVSKAKLDKEVGLWKMYIDPAVKDEVVEEKKPTANEIKVMLKERGVEFKGNAKLEDLEKLLTED